MRIRLHTASLLIGATIFPSFLIAESGNTPKPMHPNIIVIMADDQGYGDLGSFGSTEIKTPHIDQLAMEGRKFTSFMVASSLCTPSRAALLTGSYPKRMSIHKGVLFPHSEKGINPEEYTIADHLKAQGYATACIGKWHLGHHPETLPMQLGFDLYYGIPYSNDMNYPDNKGKPKGGPEGMDILWKDPASTLTKWNTPLMENEKIIELPVDQRTITRRYTDKAIEFIESNRNRPFFVYLPHSMPHIPLYVPDDTYDSDPQKAYKLVIEHLDAEVGRLIEKLHQLDLSENTYVIFTSDNGPWLRFQHHGGSAGPLRGGKFTTYEGGQRVPFILWGPGRIRPGSETSELVTTLDLLPTIAGMIGTKLPEDSDIDGLDASDLFTGKEDQSPREEFLYYGGSGRLEWIRVGKWKLLTVDPELKPAEQENLSERFLYDLSTDIGEVNNLSMEYPEIVSRLQNRMQELDAEISENSRPMWFANDSEQRK